MSNKTKWIAVGAGLGAALLLGLLIWGLYALGGDDQSSLERFRDIAVIFIVLLATISVILLIAIVAALGYLTFQIKDRVIPLLEELTGTVKRMRGATEFMTEEAVKPLLTVAGKYAKMRAMTRTITGRGTKPPKM